MELEIRLVQVLELAKAGNLRVLYFDKGDEISNLLEEVLQKEQIEYKKLKECACGKGKECKCSKEEKERYYDELLDLVLEYDIVIAFDRPYILFDIDELRQVLQNGLKVEAGELTGLSIAKPFEDYSFLGEIAVYNPFVVRENKFFRMRTMAYMINEILDAERDDVSIAATMLAVVLSGNYLFRRRVDEMRGNFNNFNFKNFKNHL